MRSYILSYDLRKPGRNYENLIAAIQKYPQWAHPLESVWIVKTSQTASEVRDNLSHHLDPNDGLIVVEFGTSWAAKSIPTDVTNWLNSVYA